MDASVVVFIMLNCYIYQQYVNILILFSYQITKKEQNQE